eukprot:1040980-Amphidinium_carterae.1
MFEVLELCSIAFFAALSSRVCLEVLEIPSAIVAGCGGRTAPITYLVPMCVPRIAIFGSWPPLDGSFQ